MAVLTIDTSDNKKIEVKIDSRTKKMEIGRGIKFLRAENCLLLIDEVLKEKKLSINDIQVINTNMGPGSFTGLRVGASISNALATLLKIPVNNKKIGELIFPVYN